MSIIMTLLIGFVAGVIAKLITPGPKEPSGFIMTTLLGVVGAFAAQFIGNALGFASTANGVGLLGAVIGSVIVLLIWGVVQRRT